jgi:hypothetical protein
MSTYCMVSQRSPFISSFSQSNTVQLTCQTDADDLGPLLTASLEPPERLSRKYWFNPVAVFATHYSIWAAIAPCAKASTYTETSPYTGSIRSDFIITAWFIMPLVVYLYQSVILQHVAKRRFLEPLSHRGQLSWPFRFGERNLRHRIDAALVAHWHIMLFGPVLDGLFWIILAGSGGMTFKGTFLSRFQLLLTLLMVAQWYLSLGTEDPNVVLGRDAQRFYIFLMVVGFARLVYDACTAGLKWDVFLQLPIQACSGIIAHVEEPMIAIRTCMPFQVA